MTTRNRNTLILPAALAAALALGACAQGPTPEQNAIMGSFSIYKAAWNSHDAKAIGAAFRADGSYTSPAAGGTIPAAAVSGFTQGLFTAIPDFHVQVVSVDPTDDSHVAEQWLVTGTWTQPFPDGPLAGAPPTKKAIQLPGASFIEFKDGKIVSDTLYFDQMAFLTQLGVIEPNKK